MIEMETRLHNAQIEAEHQSTMTAAQIVTCYLQRLCVLYEFDPTNFTLPYSKTLIASRLHIELETFSRAIKRIKQEGVVVSGTNVSFVNQTKINDFTCHQCSLSADCTAYISLNKG
jgi:CRP-like cAMP-binding protein